MREHVVFVFSFSSFFSFYLFISFLLTNRPKTTRFPTFESCPFKCVLRFMFFARRYKTLALITEIFFFNSVLLECAANVCILLESVQFLSWRICFRSPLLFFPFLNANIHFENSTFLRRPLFTFTRETLSSRKLAIEALLYNYVVYNMCVYTHSLSRLASCFEMRGEREREKNVSFANWLKSFLKTGRTWKTPTCKNCPRSV